MDWTTIILAVIGSGIGGSIVAGWYKRKDTEASTYEKLSHTLDTLQENLDQEIKSRTADRREYDLKITEIEGKWTKKVEELTLKYKEQLQALEKRVRDLEQERQRLIVENHGLRERIGELESNE